MNSGSRGNKKNIAFVRSFLVAFEGVMTALREERNMRIHLSIAIIIIVLGFFFSIATWEWVVLLLLIGGILTLELINSAIERVVDLVTAERVPLAKHAKDMAAGAVFIYAIIAVIIGIIIFVPYIKQFIT